MSPLGELARQDDYDLPDVGQPPVNWGRRQISEGVPAVNRAADVLSRYPRHVMGSILSLPQRAIENSQYSFDTGTYDPSVPVEAALTTMGTGAVAGVPVRGAEAALGAGPIRAYHSSPHDFERFDASKIGTGEGVQMYGHGLYFAENPAVSGRGGEYWKQFANRGSSGENTATEYLARAGFDREKAAQTLRDLLANPPAYTSGYNKMMQERMRQEALQLLESDKPVGPRTYEVDIKADPAHFLDWDKPLAQQPQVAQEIARKAGMHPDEFDITKGAALYRRAGDLFGPRSRSSDFNAAASSGLGETGIPGIKYLDQLSRPGPGGMTSAGMSLREPPKTSNYVVFNPGIIDILRKYGIAGAAPVGLGALAAQDQYNQP